MRTPYLPDLAKFNDLVLQPELIGMGSSFPVAAAGALLRAPPSSGPGEDVLGIGWARPDQRPEQPAPFGSGGWQQVQPQSKIDAGVRS